MNLCKFTESWKPISHINQVFSNTGLNGSRMTYDHRNMGSGISQIPFSPFNRTMLGMARFSESLGTIITHEYDPGIVSNTKLIHSSHKFSYDHIHVINHSS